METMGTVCHMESGGGGGAGGPRDISVGKQTMLGYEQFCVRHFTDRYFRVSHILCWVQGTESKVENWDFTELRSCVGPEKRISYTAM